MDMPASVKVGPHVYKILRKPKNQMPDAIGDTNFDRMEISLRQRLRKTKAQEVLVHELLHTCTYPSFTGVYAENEKYTPEDIVNATAPVLLQVLRDNPDLLEYLTR